MGNELIEKFNNQFALNTSIKSIVIYGTADCARNIISNGITDKIAGLMDQNKTGEIIEGYKVLSYDEVAALERPIIVIAARTSVIKIVYRRIKDFCKEKDIDVYDINGNLLIDEQTNFNVQECFDLKYEHLQKLIDSADIISFDIFDTLVCRNVLRPRDIFYLIDEKTSDYNFKFSTERIKAEEELNKQYIPDIFMIYDRMRENTGISETIANELLYLEIETEKCMLSVRTRMCGLINEIKEKGKKVILVSDMYFTSDIINGILQNLGISCFDNLFVSCEYGVDKVHGLFDKVEEELNVKPSKILHIGDNLIADCHSAQKAGINYFRIYSVSEMLERSGYASLLEKKLSLEENCIVAKFALDLYNDPFGGFDRSGKFVVNDDEHLVNLLLAPIIFKFSIWISQKVFEDNTRMILFPSRDGYLMEKIYKIQKEYVNLPQSKYIYVSRRATMIAAADNVELLKVILEFPGDVSFREMIISRFGIDPGPVNSLADINDNIYSELLSVCENERNNYKVYLEKELSDCEEGAVFADFVAMGRVQEAFERLVRKSMRGLYFVKRISDERGTQKLNIESLYPVEDDYSASSRVYQFYYLLECIFSSFEPSLLKFDSNGNPIFYEENRSKLYIENLDRCHEVILEYCRKMINFSNDIMNWKADINIYDTILGFFSEEYCIIDNSILLNGKNVDEFMGKSITNYNR